MSRECCISRKGRGIALSRNILLGSVLGAVLIALQCLLPAAAFASPARAQASVGTNQALDLAGISVVRLLATYENGNLGQRSPVAPAMLVGPVQNSVAPLGGWCTGLGVLVRSKNPANAAELNNWVLTDGDLVSEGQSCSGSGSPSSTTHLATIQIYGSTTYTGQLLATISQQQLATIVSGSACAPETNCLHNLALLPFHTSSELPYIDIAQKDQVAQYGVELKNNADLLPPSPLTTPTEAQLAQSFLIPDVNNNRETDGGATPTATAGSGVQQEAGMPLINKEGQLVGMHLLDETTPKNTTEIEQFLRTHVPSLPAQTPNTLHNNWLTGVNDYYQGQYAAAQRAFQQVKSESQAGGANAFLQLIAPKLNPPARKTQSPPPPPPAPTGLLGIPILWWIVGVLVLLLLLLLIVIQTVGRAGAKRRRERQRELERFKSEEEEAARQAEMELQRQQSGPRVVQQMSPQPAAAAPAPADPQTIRCPHCGQVVPREVVYCPNCKSLLSPSASGLRWRAIPPNQQQGMAEMPTRPISPAAAATFGAPPAAPISEQPTVAYPPLSEQPTVQMAPADGEKTQLALNRRAKNRLVGLVVGTRTDPGIKRKHRPNEDSLFALQGKRVLNSQVQQYGFFVVADGMGGHANGQDASRLAIQTIVNFIVPRLVSNEELSAEAYQNLLVEGVQRANQAVNEQNQREHADMGTTMTTALVIGSTAYVANVGDSRTYLYREEQGLGKVTHDHSVVASLVDAGIIKPDDIYTHPKRNQIYRSLGEKPAVEIDPFQVSLQPGDKLLLCSDGLWDMTRDPMIEQVMKKPVQPAQLVDELVQLALDGGGEDNISVIVVQVIEAAKRTGKAGMQVLAKPDTLVMPELP